MNRPVALFDFDGTLTRGDSLLPFLHYVRGKRLAVDILRASPWLAGYFLKQVDNGQAKEALLRQTLGGLDWKWLRQKGEQFAETHIPTLLRQDTLKRLAEHRSSGHCCVLVSASLDIYLEPWGKGNGFEYCLTSTLERDAGGRVTGRLLGGNCHGLEKVRRIERLLSQIGKPPKIYAYGDSKGDLPMLQFAEKGVWVGRHTCQFKNLSE